MHISAIFVCLSVRHIAFVPESDNVYQGVFKMNLMVM